MFRKQHPELGAKPGSLVISPDAAPPVIRVVDYDHERHEIKDDLTVEDCAPYLESDSTSWIDVRGLGDRQVFEQLSERLEIHPLAIEDAVNVPVRPKSEIYGNFHLVILRLIRPVDGGRLERSQVSLFVGEHALLSIQESQEEIFEKVRRRTEIGARMRAAGPDYLAYALIDVVIDAYFPVLEWITQQIEDLETEITLNANRGQVGRILALRQELQELRRDMEPMRDLTWSIMREESPWFSQDILTYMRDCYDHATTISEVIAGGLESTSQLIGLHSAMMANRMNEIMKVLTVVSAIFIPLSFLAGLYGMNFVNIPELQHPNGYFILLGVMGFVLALMIGFFWHKGWLRDE